MERAALGLSLPLLVVPPLAPDTVDILLIISDTPPNASFSVMARSAQWLRAAEMRHEPSSAVDVYCKNCCFSSLPSTFLTPHHGYTQWGCAAQYIYSLFVTISSLFLLVNNTINSPIIAHSSGRYSCFLGHCN